MPLNCQNRIFILFRWGIITAALPLLFIIYSFHAPAPVTDTYIVQYMTPPSHGHGAATYAKVGVMDERSHSVSEEEVQRDFYNALQINDVLKVHKTLLHMWKSAEIYRNGKHTGDFDNPSLEKGQAVFMLLCPFSLLLFSSGTLTGANENLRKSGTPGWLRGKTIVFLWMLLLLAIIGEGYGIYYDYQLLNVLLHPSQ